MKKLLLLFWFVVTTVSLNAVNEANRANLKFLSKDIAGVELNTTYFPDSLWDSLANASVILATELCSCVTDTKSVIISTTDTTNKVYLKALETNFANPISVFSAKKQKGLKRIPIGERGLIATSDTLDAEFYFTYGQTIGFEPRPERPDTFLVIYLKQAKKLTHDSMVTNIPSEYNLAIAHIMINLAFERNKVGGWAGYHWQKAMDVIERVKASKRYIPQEFLTPKVIQPRSPQ